MHRDTIMNGTGALCETLCRTLLSLLLLILLTGIAWGIARAGISLHALGSHLLSPDGSHDTLRQLVTDVLMVLAVVELFRTVKAYFIEGRVKVTYIIDTVLVVVITEVMGFWYREVDPVQSVIAIALIVALMAVRILAIRFSPKKKGLFEGL